MSNHCFHCAKEINVSPERTSPACSVCLKMSKDIRWYHKRGYTEATNILRKILKGRERQDIRKVVSIIV